MSRGDQGPRGLLWTEAHRPTELSQLALSDETRNVLESYIEAGEIPHLLLTGPAGSGKTTVARILIRNLNCRHMTLNASSERGIDTVRHKIGGFISGMTPERWRVPFLDEADALTPDAQTALRNQIESHADRARFILTCNFLHKIIDPIQSRCQVLEFGRPPLKERFRILSNILQAEGIQAEPKTIYTYVERFPDLRKMLMAAQRAWLSSGGGNTLPTAEAGDRIRGGDVLRMIEQKDWAGLRRATADATFDPQQSLRDLFWAVPDEHGSVGMIRHLTARGLHESVQTPDQSVHFLGVCAEIMEGL